jgi:type I site-specific restriction endonuclease
MRDLNLPNYSVKTREGEHWEEIFDEVRTKWLKLTPEEWVRQNFIHFLMNDKEVSPGLISIEKAFKLNKRIKRTDIMVYKRDGTPLMVVECKAPEVKIDQKVFDQIFNYNMVFKVKYLVVTNGLQHFCCMIDYLEGKYKFLQTIPNYSEL